MNYLKRGSRKSSVKTIHITPDGRQEKERSICDQSSGTNLINQPESIEDSTSTLRNSLEKTQQEIKIWQAENQRHQEARIAAEDRANYLENLVKEREVEILSLSSRIEALTLSNNELEENQCRQLYEAKTQYMIDLEMELKRVKDESVKMVARLQKKVKRLQETNLKSKQEYALKVFALKDDKNKLVEENEVLQEHLQLPSQDFNNTSYSADSRNNKNDIPHSLEDENSTKVSRNKLIVQLSQQVTSLDVENQELRQELEKAKMLINKSKLKGRTLEVSTKTHQKYEHQGLCVNIANLDIGSSSSEVELFG